jgi:hypothetical protein
MVMGGPRAATTWTANLLNTDTTVCLHDPLYEYKPTQLDALQIPGKRIGISDTAVVVYPEWINAHSAKKVVLWRDPEEINDRLRLLGMRQIPRGVLARRYAQLNGVKVYHWGEVFRHEIAKEICDYFKVPFCRWRFEELKKMNIQPQFERIPVGKEAAQELVRRFARELEQ